MVAKSITHARAIHVFKVGELQVLLDDMHREVHISVTGLHQQAISKQNLKTNIVSPSSSTGESVSACRATYRGHKLCLKWFGPCRVIAAHGPLVYSFTTL